jgi:acetyl esterase/lipase
MAHDVVGDPRINPRIKAILAAIPPPAATDVVSREEFVAEANTEQALEGTEAFRAVMDMRDTEEAAPSTGLRVHPEKIESSLDGNTVILAVIRPDTDEMVPCVYYIHGGGMASLSCFDGMWRDWGKIIAPTG